MANILNTKVHSIVFKSEETSYNTFETWGLVPATRPSVALPPLKSQTVDLPASDGILDYTELLLGKVPFGRRSGSWRFYTDLDKQKALGFTWDSLYADLVSKLHGKEFKVVLDDDPNYYYVGRLGVSQWRSSRAYSEISIDYNFESYKYSFTGSDDVDWQWNNAIEVPDYEILYGKYEAGHIRALNYIYHGSHETTPTYTFQEDCAIIVNLGSLIENVLLGKYGYGVEEQKTKLAADGYTPEVILNQVYVVLNKSTRLPVPGEITQKTLDAITSGKLSTGTVYQIRAGVYKSTDLNLKNGSNMIILKGDGSVSVRYVEVAV